MLSQSVVLAVAVALLTAPGAAAAPGCDVPAGSTVKVRFLTPDAGDVLQSPLDVGGLVKGKGAGAVTGVQLYVDGVAGETLPVTTPPTHNKGADGLWDGGLPLGPGGHDLTACARTASGAVAVDTIHVATPAVTTDHLPAAVVGHPYQVQLTTTVPNPLWHSATPLPSGLTLTSAGLLSGTPGAAGSPSLDLRVVGRKQPQLTARAVLTLTVTPTGGVVCAWGAGDSGQLGDGAAFGAGTAVATPVATGLTGVTAVAATRSAAYALKSDGTVWAWGDAENGQLGSAAASDTSTPVQVAGLSDVVAISGADETGYAMKSDGTVWAWGLGGYAGLGNGTYDQFSSTPVRVTGLTGVTAISGAGLTAYAVTADGSVWGWGQGGDGQLGDQPGWSGSYSTSTPVRIPGLSDVMAVSGGQVNGYALERDGTVWAWGTTPAGPQRIPVRTMTGVRAIGAGEKDVTAVRTDGTVAGLTGVTGVAHSIGETRYVVKADGSVWAWGLGDYGALGNGQGIGTYLYVVDTPVAVQGVTGASAVTGGGRTGYAVATACA